MTDGAVRISVVTPTYQGRERLETTVPCTLAQLGESDEIIFSVDGSDDGTVEFLESLAADDMRIVLEVSSVNRGRTEALNAACRRACGTIVLRLDDDILVPDRFFDLHAEEHARSDMPVGVVQPLIDVIEDNPRSSMWRAFVERNAGLDRNRFESSAEGLPACTWGPVCSVEREVGERLGWYDVRFDAYGWEDVEFGYRLRQDGVRIVSVNEAAVQHLVHWTSFSRKLLRGFDSGARMAVFAQIHGPVAVLAALGLDSNCYERPRASMLGSGWERSTWARSLAVRASILGERLFAALRWRRGYDWWVARWLSWSYSMGWREQSTRAGLPSIPPPTLWHESRTATAAASWQRIRNAASHQVDSDSQMTQFVLRSLWLRCLEATSAGVMRRLRTLVSTAARRIPSWLARRSSAERVVSGLGGYDVWVLVEAPTPSQTEGPLAVVKCLERNGLSCLLLAADARTERWVSARSGGRSVYCLEGLASMRASRRGFALIGVILGARRAVGRLADDTTGDVSGLVKLQLAFEAADGSILTEGLAAVPHATLPKLVISASEYFPPSIALRSSMQRMGVPFVTIQHGAINVVAAPFLADEYWVWTSRALDSLRTLQSTGAAMVVGHPGYTVKATHDRNELRSQMGINDSSTPILVFFSQTHGHEFSGATHFAVAAQLAAIRRSLPQCLVVIKRHPSERQSMLETLCRADERIIVAPEGVSATELAGAADVSVALGSTALGDAIRVGCCAVEALCDESAVVEPMAAERVVVHATAATVVALLSDAEARQSLLRRQAAWLRDFDTREYTFDAAIGLAVRQLMTRSIL